jgi:hypothetical protein
MTKEYLTCLDKASGVTVEMINCISAEQSVKTFVSMRATTSWVQNSQQIEKRRCLRRSVLGSNSAMQTVAFTMIRKVVPAHELPPMNAF